MDFSLDPEARQIREVVAEFVDEEVLPVAGDIDHDDEFPWDLVEQLAELDLMGMPFPEEYGGAGLDYHAYPAALEELSRGSGGLGTIVAAHISLAGNMIYAFGTDAPTSSPRASGLRYSRFCASVPKAWIMLPASEMWAATMVPRPPEPREISSRAAG